ncbi:MAG TPA: hypothetical protein VI316_05280 [Candidatus Dormibacteraeota bacterium]
MLGEAGELLGDTVGELVPPEARAHLLNAQRELLLAATLTLEHHLSQRQRQPGEGADSPRRRRTPRPVKVELE